MAERAGPTRRGVLKTLTAIGVGAVTGLGSEGLLYEAGRLELTRVDVQVPGWPADLDGVTLALLTDLHRSETVSRRLLHRAVDLALSARPDLIVLGGDYVTWGDRRYLGSMAEIAARLTAPHGVYAILGNHDNDRDVAAALAPTGIAVLRDQRTRVSINGHGIDLVGIRFWTRRARDIASITDGAHAARILLAHDPRRFREARELGFPLVVSGHTHGGQVVLPGVGAIAARKFPLASGLLTENGTTLFVSRGIGTVYVPVRWNCPPEVALLRISGQPAT